MKTVFFGPFVGEFGWEVTRWQGWVRRLIQEKYNGARIIACSYPGRHLFYPEATEFWPLPADLAILPISQRNYITDAFIGEFPKLYHFYRIPIPFIKKYYPKPVQISPIDIRGRLLPFLDDCKRKLPLDTEFIVPWMENHHLNVSFGIRLKQDPPQKDSDIQTLPVPYEEQIWRRIAPTERGRAFLSRILKSDEKIFAVFPRRRLMRRPDKNWDEQRYLELARRLHDRYQMRVAFLGSPNGAYFPMSPEPHLIDLINIPEELRADVHAAALEKSNLAIGSISGAIVFASMCGSKAITWSAEELQHYVYLENFMNSPLLCYPRRNPSVPCLFDLVEQMLSSEEPFAFGQSYRLTSP